MDSAGFIYLFMGPMLLVLAVLFLLFPPRKINYVYGYRTPRSMKSREAWNYANRFSAKYLLGLALLTCLLQAVLILLLPMERAIVWLVAIMVAGVIAGIPLTEIMLKRKGF